MSPKLAKIDKAGKHEQYRHPELTETSKHKPIPYRMKTLSDTSGNSCNYRENSSMIIKSKTSLNNGAFYLKNAFGLGAKECVEKCCYTQNCNLAVYEDKEEYSCYLFDCGTPSKCSFAHHGNYSVMSLQAHNYQPHAHQQYHENELESLGKTPRPTPAVPTTRTPKPETPTPNPPKVKVPLYGDCDIDWGEQCGDRNAECRDEQCKCKEGYHAIYAYCRKICSTDEFQCNNKGYDRNVPDCIDSKHKCDGVPQCADGSDEANCPTKTEDNKDTDNGEEDKEVNEHGVHADNTKPKPPEAVIPDKDKSVNKDTDEEIVKIEEEDKYGKEEEKIDTEINEDKDEKDQVDTQNTVTKSSTSVSETPKVPKTTVKTVDFEVPKKVIVKSPTDSNQGPIVALALGLGICLMLLIFVGCRLRTVKQRIRRGKSLHSNEADYLINGMYL